MKKRSRILLLSLLIIFSMACGLAGQGVPQGQVTQQSQSAPQEETTTFSAQAVSPASVDLKWPAVVGATGYLLEGQYGDGDYFQVDKLPGDRTEYTHFVVPGSSQITFRLSAVKDSGNEEIDSVAVKIPALSPNPFSVDFLQPFAPVVSGIPDFSSLPTMDPQNPDMNAVATLQAMTEGMGPDSFQPEVKPVEARQEISPEGGTVTLTSPNGVVFTLVVPAGAVAETTKFRLIPIESITEFPFAGGLLAGVQIRPPIPFAAPLALTITLPPDSPPADVPLVIGFTVSSLSNELFLAPVSSEGGNAFSMTTSWGDTFGLASATLAEIEAQAARIPTDPGAQMAQQLAALRVADPDPGPESDTRIAVQVMQGFLQQTEGLTAHPPSRGGGGLAAPAVNVKSAPNVQYESPAKLLTALFWAEAIWNWLQQMLHLVPGTPPPPGEIGQMLIKLEKATVEEMTPLIKDFMDDHDGCRTFLGLSAETFRQILRVPATPYQQALANNYRARFGPPPSPECEFRLKIVRSSIKTFDEGGDSNLGSETVVATVHSEPWPLELAMREFRYFLRGSVGTLYDEWHETYSKCPPTMQLRPFPTSLIWITDLAFAFDDDERVSDFTLKGVELEQTGTNVDSVLTTDQPRPGECKVLKNFRGANPVDDWGLAFAGLHTAPRGLDNWVITGDDSYVATDTISGRTEGFYTEDTTIVLTVNQK